MGTTSGAGASGPLAPDPARRRLLAGAAALLAAPALGGLAGCTTSDAPGAGPRGAPSTGGAPRPGAPGGGAGDDGDGGTPASPAPPTADEALAVPVATSKRALLAAYDATAERHPGLAGRLRALRAEGAAHLTGLAALVPAAGEDPSASPGPPASTAPTAAPTTAPTTAPTAAPTEGVPPVPRDPAAAVAALARREAALAASRLDALEGAGASPELARLVAAVGASEAVHAALLGAA
ncbi:hypothetical protein [Vallicoccus soli]|uniref:DUF4439 domain-containing protein n=1 Tax=Vallicoccus soli TaxID=2339232 RepID=A0A3A3YXW9_9ACTN|nr:hypothetical protein [Vallicoccus soli]RJK96498.1 hypothetical protein D5H78_09840 [Vallicoccus soli]